MMEILVAFALVAALLCGLAERHSELSKTLVKKMRVKTSGEMICVDATNGRVRCERKDVRVLYVMK